MDPFDKSYWSWLQVELWVCTRSRDAVRLAAHAPGSTHLADLSLGPDGVDDERLDDDPPMFVDDAELIGMAIVKYGCVCSHDDARKEVVVALSKDELRAYPDPEGGGSHGQFFARADVLRLWPEKVVAEVLETAATQDHAVAKRKGGRPAPWVKHLRRYLQLRRLSTGDDFATSDLYDSYVSSGINGNPFAISENLPSFTEDSVAQWGVRAILQPTAEIHFAAGVYNADPDVAKDGKHGVDFVLNPQDGVLAIAEAGYHWNQAEDDTGLPGNATIGGYYDSNDFDPVDDANGERDGNEGFYLLLDQMAYREHGPGSDQGLTPWVAFTFAPAERVNTIPFSASGGMVYQGLMPGRDDDLTGLAVYYGKFSGRLEDQNAETVVEANHRLQLAPWLYVTPDFQYVIRPNGQSDIDDAAVFGGEIGIDF